MQTIVDELKIKGKAAHYAAREVAKLHGGIKNQALLNIADALNTHQDFLLTANGKDYQTGKQNGLTEVLLDRLLLNPERLQSIAKGVRNVAALPDPVGETMEMRTMPNGLQIGKRRVPLGVIGAIYESRPDVTVDISTLCLKSGKFCSLSE